MLLTRERTEQTQRRRGRKDPESELNLPTQTEPRLAKQFSAFLRDLCVSAFIRFFFNCIVD